MMNRKFLILFVLFIWSALSVSQAQEKDWYRFYVKKSGVYRLTFDELRKVLPLSTLDARSIKIFYRGTEIPIVVTGSNGQLLAGDYIEFYAKGPDTYYDQQMMKNGGALSNPYQPSFSFDVPYFLTFELQQTASKRLQTQPFSSPTGTAVTFYEKAILKSLNNIFSMGKVYPESAYEPNNGEVTYDSEWNEGKGWTGGAFGFAQNATSDQVDNFFTLDYANFSGDARKNSTLEVSYLGRTNTSSSKKHIVSLSYGFDNINFAALGVQEWEDHDVSRGVYTLSALSLASNSSLILKSTLDRSMTKEYVSISYARLLYPSELLLSNGVAQGSFYGVNTSTLNLEVGNATKEVDLWLVDDIYAPVRYKGKLVGDKLQFSIPGTRSNQSFIIQNDPIVIAGESLKLIKFVEIDPNANYFIVSNRSLNALNGVDQYKQYRESTAGGAHKVQILYIDDIYNTFTYGEKTPYALRLMAENLIAKADPKFLFIIGRGFIAPYLRSYDQGNKGKFEHFVPTLGFPGSDIVISEGLGGVPEHVPAIPTGRISAINGNQVLNYLNKVKEFEQNTKQSLAHKRSIFLSGGGNERENLTFYNYSKTLEVYRNNYFAGGVSEKYRKSSSDATELILINEKVNEGVGLISLFGHSSISTTDFTIGFSSNPVLGYNNKGKYPFLIVNGCNAGDIFNQYPVGNYGVSLGEDWTLEADRGAIGYVAHSHFGFAANQRQFNEFFYEQWVGDSSTIDKPIGEILQTTVKEYLTATNNHYRAVANSQQFVGQFDPAISLFPFDAADFSIPKDEISFSSFTEVQKFSSKLDSFQVAIPIENFGQNQSLGDIEVAGTRTFPDGNSISLGINTIPAIAYKDTIYFTVYQSQYDINRAPGINTFEFEIDPEGSIKETNKQNNKVVVNIDIPQGGLAFSYPQSYDIVNTSQITLAAYNDDVDVINKAYVMQIDTAKNFNSSFFKSIQKRTERELYWTVDLPLADQLDTVVYHARTRLASFGIDDDTTWSYITFSYIKDAPEGWGQLKSTQFEEGQLNNLKWQMESMVYDDKPKVLQLETVGGGLRSGSSLYKINYEGVDLMQVGDCFNGNPLIAMMVFDKTTKIPKQLGYTNHLVKCGRPIPSRVIHVVQANISWKTIGWLGSFTGQIQEGDHVVIMSMGAYNWDASNKAEDPYAYYHYFENLGLKKETIVDNYDAGDPLIFNGIKGGAIGDAEVVIYPDTSVTANNKLIRKTIEFKPSSSEGYLLSTLIGPAKQWGSVELDIKKETTDNFYTEIWGVNVEGAEVLINTVENKYSINISDVSAKTYPYLKTKVVAVDSIEFTSPTLRNWIVNFKQAPNGILVPQSLYDTDKIRIQEGDSIRGKYLFRNLTNYSFDDSIKVVWSINSEPALEQMYAPLGANDTLTVTGAIPTKGFDEGTHQLSVFVNPQVQPEKSYTENTDKFDFHVFKDQTQPLLEVYFDGRQIIDGEIVAPDPEVSLVLEDENPFIDLSDTSLFLVYLKKPCEGCDFEQMYFSDKETSITKEEDKNKVEVNFSVPKLDDGKYQMRIVSKDETGNNAGLEPYEVSFEVVNEESITNFYPYPNPFSDKMRFVFTLTGSLPDDIQIDIMTITGKIVKTIMMSDLGSIHVGNNLTDYYWDGRDEFGDELANGVYLYRVKVTQNGEMMKARETSADNFIKHGLGKIYIMR